MRSLNERPSASDISVTLIRFGRKRRLVLMLEWLTVWPDRGPFPVRSQRRDMSKSLRHAGPEAGDKNGPFRGTRTYKVREQGRQVRRLGSGSGSNRPGWADRARRCEHRFDAFRSDDPCTVRAADLPQGLVLRRYPQSRLALAALGAVALACLPGTAEAQTKLEARYAVPLAGIPLGTGTWVIDIAADQYTAVASGRTTGLVKLVSDGSGTTGSKAVVQGANVISSGYVASMISDKKADEVRMTMGGGAVKTYVA